MNIGDVKLIYVSSCVLLALIIVLPTLIPFISSSQGEHFSELYILGSDHALENIPFNVAAGSLSTVYLGIGNHMGELTSYLVYVKMRNQTESMPNSLIGDPSSLSPIFEYRAILDDGEVSEKEFSFSIDDVSFDGNESRVSGLSINGNFVSVEKVAVWAEEENGFLYQFLFELWIYNPASSSFEFNNRSVWFMFNLTET